ncbi:MAG: hypothetical protein QXF06_03535 [Archaeoglobaceae archaeon]
MENYTFEDRLGRYFSSLEELDEFLVKDDTDQQTYNETFKCGDFARMLVKRMRQAGYKGCYVMNILPKAYNAIFYPDLRINEGGNAHSIVLVIVRTRHYSGGWYESIVIIEPQADIGQQIGGVIYP